MYTVIQTAIICPLIGNSTVTVGAIDSLITNLMKCTKYISASSCCECVILNRGLTAALPCAWLILYLTKGQCGQKMIVSSLINESDGYSG